MRPSDEHWAGSPDVFLLRVGPEGKCSSRRGLWSNSRWRASRSSPKVRQPMSRSLRRFEILLPLRFNDGQPVPDDLIADTLLEIEQQFGAVTSETQMLHGSWQHL